MNNWIKIFQTIESLQQEQQSLKTELENVKLQKIFYKNFNTI